MIIIIITIIALLIVKNNNENLILIIIVFRLILSDKYLSISINVIFSLTCLEVWRLLV